MGVRVLVKDLRNRITSVALVRLSLLCEALLGLASGPYPNRPQCGATKFQACCTRRRVESRTKRSLARRTCALWVPVSAPVKFGCTALSRSRERVPTSFDASEQSLFNHVCNMPSCRFTQSPSEALSSVPHRSLKPFLSTSLHIYYSHQYRRPGPFPTARAHASRDDAFTQTTSIAPPSRVSRIHSLT